MSKSYKAKIPVVATDGVTGPFARMSAATAKFRQRLSGLSGVASGVMASGIVDQFAKIKDGVLEMALAGDAVAKTADKLGVGVEAYQELAFAADLSGVSSNDLEASLKALTVRLGEAKEGQGSLKGFLEKTNPALLKQVVAAKDSGEAFNLLIEEMARIEDPAKKASFANQAFSEVGLGLINMAKGGVAGIQEMRQQAREMGEVMSEETARSSEGFNDSMRIFEATLKGIKVTFGGVLLPVFTQFFEKLTPITKATADFFRDAESGGTRVKVVFGLLSVVIGVGLLAAVMTVGMSVYTSLLPALTVLGAVVSSVGGAFTWVTTALFGNTIAQIKNAAAQRLVTISRSTSLALLGVERTALTGSAVLTAVLTGKMSLATAAQWAFNAALAANPVGLIVGGIALLVAAIGGFLWYSEDARAVVLALWKGFKTFFGMVLEIPGAIAQSWNPALAVPLLFSAAWGGIKAFVQALPADLQQGLMAPVDWIVSKWNYLINTPSRVLSAWSALPGWAKAIVGFLSPLVSVPLLIADNWETLTAKFKTAMNALGSVGSFLGFGADQPAAGTAAVGGGRGQPLATGAAAAPNVFNSSRTERSEVKVTFDKLPRGVQVVEDKPAKGAEIEYTGLALDGAL